MKPGHHRLQKFRYSGIYGHRHGAFYLCLAFSRFAVQCVFWGHPTTSGGHAIIMWSWTPPATEGIRVRRRAGTIGFARRVLLQQREPSTVLRNRASRAAEMDASEGHVHASTRLKFHPIDEALVKILALDRMLF